MKGRNVLCQDPEDTEEAPWAVPEVTDLQWEAITVRRWAVTIPARLCTTVCGDTVPTEGGSAAAVPCA